MWTNVPKPTGILSTELLGNDWKSFGQEIPPVLLSLPSNSWSLSSSNLIHSSGGPVTVLFQSISLTVGGTYYISLNVNSNASDSPIITLGDTLFGEIEPGFSGPLIFQGIVQSTSINTNIGLNISTSGDLNLNSISVKQIVQLNPWTGVGNAKPTYDELTIIYDDPNVYYDGSNPLAWTEVAKPTTNTWTNISKPS